MINSTAHRTTTTSTSISSKLRSNTSLLAASAAAIAVVMSACGSSTTTSDVAVPGTDAVVTTIAPEAATPASEAPAASSTASDGEAAAPVDDSPLDDNLTARQFLPASGFEVPCAEYFEATDFPLIPCDKGPLVELFQGQLSLIDRSVDVDGFYGENTMDAVQRLQRQFGMYDTGVADDVLLEQMGPSDDMSDPEGDEPLFGEDGGFLIDGEIFSTDQVKARCNAVLDFDETIEITDDLIFACDDVDVAITSGD